MDTAMAWLKAGSPPHFITVICALLVVEYAIGKTTIVKPNSTLGVVFAAINGIGRMVLRILAPGALATVDALETKAADSTAPAGVVVEMPPQPPGKTGLGVLLPFLAFAALASQACGGIIPASKQALAAGEHLESTAISALEQADKIRQHEIVDPLLKAHKPDEAEAAIAVYRKQRQPVIAAVTHTATITSLLATAIPLVEVGVKAVGGKPIDLPALLSDLFASLTSLRSTLAEFGISLGGK